MTLPGEATPSKQARQPHILFFSAKWHNCRPENGLSNAESILWGPFSTTGLGTYDCFLSDEEYLKSGQPCDAALLERCKTVKPDILVLAWMPSAPEYNPQLKTLQSIRYTLKIPIVAIWYDTWADLAPRVIDMITPFVDVSIIADSLDHFVESPHKDRYIHLFHPADIRVFHDPEIWRDITISFNGGINGLRDRISGLNALSTAGVEVLKCGGQAETPLTLEEYARVFMRSKISLNFSLSGEKLTLKGRTLEATLCGSMLLESWNQQTVKWFVPMVEYVTFSDEKELVEKARYYAVHDEERQAIALRGRAKARQIGDGKAFWGSIITEVDKVAGRPRSTMASIMDYVTPAPATQSPLVSIFLFCKDAARTIRRSIESVLAQLQSYDNIEYVVQDGASTDGTLEILQAYAPKFGGRMRLVSEPDAGPADAFFKAIRRCTGSIIGSCLADEELLPNAITWAVNRFQETPEAGVIHGDIFNTDLDGTILEINPANDFDLAGYLSHQVASMHFAASFFKKAALEQAGLYSRDWDMNVGDFEIWVRLSLHTKIVHYPQVLAKYAVHPEELSERPDVRIKFVAGRANFLKRIFSGTELPADIRALKEVILGNFFFWAANSMMSINRPEEAEKYLMEIQRLKQKARPSELDLVIPPEIKNDEFYYLIRKLAAEEHLDAVLEIGSSAGGGSTEAFVTGLRQNPDSPRLFCMEVSKPRFAELKTRYAQDPFVHPYNVSSVPPAAFPEEKEVELFYRYIPTALNNYPLEQVLGWRVQDLEYIQQSGVETEGIEMIKRKNSIDTFDMVLIDGSEFTGKAELDRVYGARIILLDDINGFKNYANYKRLKEDSSYRLIAENWQLRSGYAAFVRS